MNVSDLNELIFLQITPTVAWNDVGNSTPTSMTTIDEKPILQLKSDENSVDAFLAAGNAERTFFSVCGATKSRQYDVSNDVDDEDDSDDENVAQRRRLISDVEGDADKCVRASIQVILGSC